MKCKQCEKEASVVQHYKIDIGDFDHTPTYSIVIPFKENECRCFFSIR